jgi:CHAT domain-containing protein
MYRRLFKGDHPALAMSINSLAGFYNNLGRYTEAEPLYKEALEMRRRLFKGDHPDLAISINSMAFFYYYTLGKYAEAEPLYKEALSMYQRLFKSDHFLLANSILSMAYFYKGMGRYAEAEPLYKEALSMYQRLFKGDHPSLANTISNMAWFYNEQGRYAEAEPLYKEALEMSRRLFKGVHNDLANCIDNMARFYDAQSRYAEAEPLYLEALQIYTKVLENYFPSLSEKEKQQFWNTIRHNFARFNIFAIKRANENPSILCEMYDNQLSTKGLLFNSAVKIKARISNSGDTSLIKLYNRWKDTKELLVKLYKKSESELKNEKINRDSIEQYANSLEKEISLKSENYKQSYEKKKVSWKAIQTLLKPDEAALEVIRIRYYDKLRSIDSVYYACLIVNEQTEENPELVLLEDGKKLEGEYYQSYREAIKKKQKDIKSYNRYWSKLEEKLKGYKKIYFSADGVYNKINPSTLMMPDGKYLLDIQDIQQINSTKDILLGYYQKKEESNMYNSAVLVGNPNFALSEEQVKNISKTIRGEAREEGTTEPTTIERGITLTRLPGTEQEIKEIEKFLRSKKWEVKSYLDDMAVKGAVKSANSPRVLHIATHGLFSEDIEKSGKEVFGFEEKKLSENPLLRSGLFFSGAENNINKIGERENQEDSGILTAYEAMNLNLDRTELVVLSACETGLGDIRNGEGVFGLRRAFQQAGAKSLIMSLWTVSDEATQELMSKFYRNWVEGMSKRESFKNAQQEVRNKYPAPYFWGAFVMVGE